MCFKFRHFFKFSKLTYFLFLVSFFVWVTAIWNMGPFFFGTPCMFENVKIPKPGCQKRNRNRINPSAKSMEFFFPLDKKIWQKSGGKYINLLPLKHPLTDSLEHPVDFTVICSVGFYRYRLSGRSIIRGKLTPIIWFN